MEKDGTYKTNRQNKNEVVLERVEEGRIMLVLIKRRKRNWLGHYISRNSLLKNALEGMVKGKMDRGKKKNNR